jgi:hypothetical protein
VPEGTTGRLVIEVPFGTGGTEVWTGAAWTKVKADDRLIALPPDALRDGVVLLRVSPDVNNFFDPSSRMVLRGATAKDDL